MHIHRGSVETASSDDRPAAVARTRSRLSNHRDLLPDLDGRSSQARRFRDVCRQLAADQGGLESLSETRLQLIRRFSALCVHAEALESRLANGERIDISEHSQISSTLVRIASRLGVDRRAKEIVPSLEAYLRENYSDEDENEAADAP